MELLPCTCFSLSLLIQQFDEVLNLPDPKEGLGKLIDPRLGDNYPPDAALKVSKALKGKCCESFYMIAVA